MKHSAGGLLLMCSSKCVVIAPTYSMLYCTYSIMPCTVCDASYLRNGGMKVDLQDKSSKAYANIK